MYSQVWSSGGSPDAFVSFDFRESLCLVHGVRRGEAWGEAISITYIVNLC